MRWPLVVVLLSAAWTATAIRLQYDNAKVHSQSLRQRFFAADSTTTVDFHFSIKKTNKVDGYLEGLVMFGNEILSFPGKSRLHPGVLSFCCSEEYRHAGLCPTEGLLVLPKQQEVVARYLIPFGAEFRSQLRLNTTGPHALVFSNCGPNAALISGSIEIKSARGSLPLHLYNLSTFYHLAIWLIGVILVAIIIALIPFRNEIHRGHGLIIVAMILAIVEFSLWTKSMAIDNDSGTRDSSLESLALFCALFRRTAVLLSAAVALYGYGLSSGFRLADISPIDQKHLAVYASLYAIIQALCWLNLSAGSFVQAYELSPFFVPMLIDVAFLTLLIRPALRTKALLYGTRPRTPSAAAFDRLLMFMAAMLILLAAICAVSINFAENRGNIRHPMVAFLLPEAILQMAHVSVAIAVVLCIFPLGPHVANLARFSWRLPVTVRGTESRNPDELAPLGSGS